MLQPTSTRLGAMLTRSRMLPVTVIWLCCIAFLALSYLLALGLFSVCAYLSGRVDLALNFAAWTREYYANILIFMGIYSTPGAFMVLLGLSLASNR